MPEPASDACHPDDLREVSGRLGCANGYGSITQVTGSFGFAAAAPALRAIQVTIHRHSAEQIKISHEPGFAFIISSF